jgi:prepilin-type N-terminal cleavage/methylation domain-containing protein
MCEFQKTRTKGYTMVEMFVAVIIICVLVSIAVPLYSKAIEQARLDSAAGNLKTIWSAQRAYWLKHQAFADSLTKLGDEDLISASLTQTQGVMYVYSIDSAAQNSFVASAVRSGSGVWSGTIQIDELGQLAGSVSKEGTTLLPQTLE